MLSARDPASGALVWARSAQDVFDDTERRPQGLVCVSCFAEAVFVRRGVNGQSPAFRVDRHEEECPLFVDSDAKPQQKAGAVASTSAPRTANRTKAVIKGFPVRSHKAAKSRRPAVVNPNREGSRTRDIGDATHFNSEMNLKELLGLLASDEEFRRSDFELVIDAGRSRRVRDYCVNVGELDQPTKARRGVFWGTVKSVTGRPAGPWWVELCGGVKALVKLPSREQLTYLMNLAGVDAPYKLAGSLFIFDGWMSPTKAEGRPCFFPQVLDTFGVIFAEPDEDC